MKPFFRLCHVSKALLRVGVACLLTLLGTLVVISGPSPVTHASGPCPDGWHVEGSTCFSNCNPGTHETGYGTSQPTCITDARDPQDAIINPSGSGGKCSDGWSFENGQCYSNCDPGTYMAQDNGGPLMCLLWPSGFPGN